MSDVNPPAIGTDPWGADLNAYFAHLEGLVTNVGNGVTALDARLDQVEASITQILGRLDALEEVPEYVVNSYSWMYSNQAPPPTGSQVRFDNADLSLATQAVFRLIDNDGADRTPVFQLLTTTSLLRINDWNDANVIHRFHVTGSAVFGASDVAVPVVWVSGSGTVPNAKANVAFAVVLDF